MLIKCWNLDARLRPDFELLNSELTVSISQPTSSDDNVLSTNRNTDVKGLLQLDDENAESGYADDKRGKKSLSNV